MKLLTILISSFLFLNLVSCPLKSMASETRAIDQKTTDPKNNIDKAVVVTSDPARKRGFELGYDLGVKAGKSDKTIGRKPNPNAHDEYKMGDKSYRYEYGNRARFLEGYQAGFSRGYKSGYSREKIDTEAAKKDQEKEKLQKESKKISSEVTPIQKPTSETSPPPVKKKIRKISPEEDAL
jgi:hypothetical protein